MKTTTLIFLALTLGACAVEVSNDKEQEHAHHDHHHAGEGHRLSPEEIASMNIQTGPVQKRNLGTYIRTNGMLAVPPQNRAVVSTIVGANITSIEVIPGEVVKKGQILATMSHPNLISIQTDYIRDRNQLDYLEQDFKRQELLYASEVGSGKTFQQTKADYLTLKGKVTGLEAQLRQLDIDPKAIRDGEVAEIIPLRSPISGAVHKVSVSIGQYAEPQAPLFEVVDNHHIHVDLYVYEKDISKVSKGQKVMFHVESAPEQEFPALIFAVGSTFEEQARAVSVHAEISGEKPKSLLPGMYVRGRILLEEKEALTLPNDALVRDGDKYYIIGVSEGEGGSKVFQKYQVSKGLEDQYFVEIKPIDTLPEGGIFAYTNAYFILSDMMDMGHDHGH